MSRELKCKHSPTLNIEDNTSSEAIKSSINEVNSKIKNVPQKTKIEDGKLYLLNESGNKIDTGTTIPSGGAGGTVDLTDYAKKNEIPNKTSQLTNDSNFLTSIPSEYITEDELNAKNYLTEHQNLDDYAKKSDIPTIPTVPTKVSELVNDKNYISSIPNNYVTEETLATKGYLTQHQSLDGYVKQGDIPTKLSQFTNDEGYITEIPDEYITEDELNAKNYLTTHQDISGKVDKIDGKGLSTEDFTTEEKTKLQGLSNYDDTDIKNGITEINTKLDNTVKKTIVEDGKLYLTKEDGTKLDAGTELPKGTIGDVDLTDYAKKTDIPAVPTKTSELQNDSGFLTTIPEEYVTETKLDAKGYLTQHQSLDDYVKKTELPTVPTKTSELTNDSNFLTSVPDEYVTDDELTAKGYLTSHQSLDAYAKKVELPSKVSQLENDKNYISEIPSEYITETELTAKGYLTEHQDISNKVDKVTGKQLSTEDYTTPEKTKLASLENYDDTEVKTDLQDLKDNQIVLIEDGTTTGIVDTEYSNLNTTDKTIVGAINEIFDKNDNIPIKTIIEDGKLYLIKSDNTKIDTGTELPNSEEIDLTNYVQKETGKSLSSNDYTTVEKEKLASLTNYDDTAVKNDINTLKNSQITISEEDTIDKIEFV